MHLRNDLEEKFCELLAQEKCYQVEAICNGYGLPSGEEGDDPCKSKRKYVERRLRGWSMSALIEAGARAIKEYSTRVGFEEYVFDLQEAIRLAQADGTLRVSEITRREIVERLDELGRLEGRQSPSDFLCKVWPKLRGKSYNATMAWSTIAQHMVRNDDWSPRDLLEHLGVRTCSDELFFRLIEEVVHPVTRKGEEQRQYVEALNPLLRVDGFMLVQDGSMSGAPVFRVVPATPGVQGRPRNLVFGSIHKPDLYVLDLINNDLAMVSDPRNPLWYDVEIGADGLSWGGLVDWWARIKSISSNERSTEEDLYKRLAACVGINSPPEKNLFRGYYALRKEYGWKLPALLPQVWLHYDPRTVSERKETGRVIARSRMDFLLLLSHRVRVVIEVDGKHHYCDEEGKGRPELYAGMVAEDRRLRLLGYEVFRFGSTELDDEKQAATTVQHFARALFAIHGVIP